MQSNKTILWYWCIWFFLGNSLLFWLIGLNYISTVSWLGSGYFISKQPLLFFFTVLTYLGHLGVLAILPCGILLPLIFIFPKRNFILPLAVLIASVSAILLAADTVTYQLYRFHLNGIIFNLIFSAWNKDFFDISLVEVGFTILIFAAIGLGEWCYAVWLWRRFKLNKLLMGLGKWPAILFGLSLFYSYSIVIFSVNNATAGRIFLEVARVFPLYTDTLGAILYMKEGKIALERLTESFLIQPAQAHSPLHYPSVPLQYVVPQNPMNIVIIAIDAWRFDMLKAEVMPTVSEFAKDSWTFNNHYSGGNSTGPGIFSLFYAIPSTYWTAMESAHRSPLFIDALLKQHYQMGIFSSAALNAPAFHHTVFQAIPALNYHAQKAKTPYERDLMVTQKFSAFLKTAVKSKAPFFSFLFYDSAHSYCLVKQAMYPLQPAVKLCNRATLSNFADPLPYFNRYKNALQLVDQQVQQVLDLLKSQHVLDHTIVIITGDHGEEFNDNHLGYWGHASNFTRYQVQTPLVVHWPGKQSHVFTHQTSHFDIAPTLLHDVLGCRTEPSQYSFGHHLLAVTPPPYLIIGSYIGFGILESDRITEIFPTGNFHIEQLNGNPVQEIKLNVSTMQHVLGDLRRFYKT